MGWESLLGTLGKLLWLHGGILALSMLSSLPGPGDANTQGYTDRLSGPSHTQSRAMLSLLQVNVELDYIPHFLFAAPPDST